MRRARFGAASEVMRKHWLTLVVAAFLGGMGFETGGAGGKRSAAWQKILDENDGILDRFLNFSDP